jgi:hypothetical protein
MQEPPPSSSLPLLLVLVLVLLALFTLCCCCGGGGCCCFCDCGCFSRSFCLFFLLPPGGGIVTFDDCLVDCFFCFGFGEEGEEACGTCGLTRGDGLAFGHLGTDFAAAFSFLCGGGERR